jgi:hypothetical protein
MPNSGSYVNAFSAILDKIYTSFLLRDIFGKIIPGLIFIITLDNLTIEYDFIEISNYENFEWFIILGLSWFVAFAFQSIGGMFHWINQYNKEDYDDESWYKALNKFKKKTRNKSELKNYYERIVVIKEGCGNLSFVMLALVIIAVVLKIKICIIHVKSLEFWVFSIVIGLIIFGLKRMHNNHVNKQCVYLESVIGIGYRKI